MRCAFPAVDIPDELQPLLDRKPYVNQDNTSDDLACSQFSQDLQQAVLSYDITFTVGILFDGYANYSRYTAVNVYPPPDICFNETFIGPDDDMIIRVCTTEIS